MDNELKAIEFTKEQKALIKEVMESPVSLIGRKTGASKEAYENDRELFLDLQNDYFTTKGTMGDNPFKGVLKNIFGKKKKEEKK